MTTIIGLDLGKFNSAACTFLTGDAESLFTTICRCLAPLTDAQSFPIFPRHG